MSLASDNERSGGHMNSMIRCTTIYKVNNKYLQNSTGTYIQNLVKPTVEKNTKKKKVNHFVVHNIMIQLYFNLKERTEYLLCLGALSVSKAAN